MDINNAIQKITELVKAFKYRNLEIGREELEYIKDNSEDSGIEMNTTQELVYEWYDPSFSELTEKEIATLKEGITVLVSTIKNADGVLIYQATTREGFDGQINFKDKEALKEAYIVVEEFTEIKNNATKIKNNRK